MTECPRCGRSAVSVFRKLFIGHTTPVACRRCGEKVVLSLHALLSVVPLIAVLAAGPLLLRDVGTAGVFALLGGAVLLAPVLNVTICPLIPIPSGSRLRARLLSFVVAATVGASAVNFALAVARFAPVPASLGSRRITEHFEIYSNLDPAALDHHVRFFEEFVSYFEANYFPVAQKRRLTMFLFAGDAAYRAYVRKHYTDFTPYGFYSAPQNLIVVNGASGLGTATHELVHHCIACGFVEKPPSWIDEGFATFFEKFIGYLDARGRLHISLGYFSNWRFPHTRSVVAGLSLEALARARDVDQSAARSLMLFLHRKGLLETFIDRARHYRGSDHLALLSDVCGEPVPAIEREWKRWITNQPIDGDVLLVTQSFVKPYGEWTAWWEANRHRLIWSEAEKRYRVRASTVDPRRSHAELESSRAPARHRP